MRLLVPLTLEDVTTGDVNLVPTKKFFKPVVVLKAPLDAATAALLECGYLIDKAGNPHPFEGSHKLIHELSGAEVTFVSQVTGEVVVKSEKIAHFSCFRIEKVGLQIQLRIHLPDGSPDELFQVLTFLSQLNKEPFKLVVRDAQGSLVDEKADLAAPIDGKPSSNFNYAIQVGKRPGLIGYVRTMEVVGEWISGWECKGPGFVSKPEGGKQLVADSKRYPTEQEALNAAAGSLLEFAKGVDHTGSREIKALGELVDWCIQMVPGLSKEEKPPAAAGPRVVH